MSDSDGDIAYAVDKGKAGDTGQELGYVKKIWGIQPYFNLTLRCKKEDFTLTLKYASRIFNFPKIELKSAQSDPENILRDFNPKLGISPWKFEGWV